VPGSPRMYLGKPHERVWLSTGRQAGGHAIRYARRELGSLMGPAGRCWAGRHCRGWIVSTLRPRQLQRQSSTPRRSMACFGLLSHFITATPTALARPICCRPASTGLSSYTGHSVDSTSAVHRSTLYTGPSRPLKKVTPLRRLDMSARCKCKEKGASK